MKTLRVLDLLIVEAKPMELVKQILTDNFFRDLNKKFICKGSELTEEIASRLIESDAFTRSQDRYKEDEIIAEAYNDNSALKSFQSLIESKGFYWGINPRGNNSKPAEKNTFNLNRTLILKIKKNIYKNDLRAGNFVSISDVLLIKVAEINDSKVGYKSKTGMKFTDYECLQPILISKAVLLKIPSFVFHDSEKEERPFFKCSIGEFDLIADSLNDYRSVRVMQMRFPTPLGMYEEIYCLHKLQNIAYMIGKKTELEVNL